MVALSKAEAPVTAIGEFKIKLERAPLLKSLARLQSIVEKRNTIPILSHIKLEAAGSTHSTTSSANLLKMRPLRWMSIPLKAK